MKIKGMDQFKEIIRLVYSLIPYRIRKLDKEFFTFLLLLKENESKSYEEVRNFQFLRLKQQVENAYNFSKFYRKKYDKFGFHPKRLNDIIDIKKIPMLSKEEARRYSKLLVLNNITKKVYPGYTSGTTGKPLEVFNDKISNSREWASICYQFERIGYKSIDGRVEFRGYIEDNIDYIYFPDRRILRINIIKMNESNIYKIIKKINATGYQFFQGYPSAIYKLARILEKKNIQINPRAIILTSEVLYEWQMELIDKIFPYSKKIAHYGQAERVATAAWDNNRAYHFVPSYGILEIDNKNKEMIATSLINEVMPLIRYKLTDSVEGFQEKPLKSEKTLFPIIETIYGRIEDFTYDLKGNLIPPAVVTFPFKELKQIEACKIIQNTLNDFDLIIETKKNNQTIFEVKNIIIELKKIYGIKVNFKVHFVNKIPVDNSGKFRWIECKIKKE